MSLNAQPISTTVLVDPPTPEFILPGERAGRVLVISPHPDDESIGPGGTLARHSAAGDQVRCIFLTSGEQGGHGRPPSETARLREREAEQAAGILGLASLEFWRLADGAIEVTDGLARRLSEAISAFDPACVFVTHPREMHADHRAAARLVRQALRRFPDDQVAPVAWLYEVWSPMHRFDHVVDITGQLSVKLAAIRAHVTQCEAMQFDEAFTALARYRGEMHSWPGGEYAEVFQDMCTGKTHADVASVAAARGEQS